MTMFLDEYRSVIVVMISTPCTATSCSFSSSTNHGIVMMVVGVRVGIVMK